MSAFLRAVGDPLNLKYKLSPSSLGTGLFARAFLTDRTGAALATLDLTEIAPGVYSNNTFTMPDTPQVVARFQAYKDAGFTQEACEFPDTIDIFELGSIGGGSTTVTINAARIEGEIAQDKIQGVVGDSDEVLAQIENDQAILGQINDDEINAEVKTGETIQGVVDEQ